MRMISHRWLHAKRLSADQIRGTFTDSPAVHRRPRTDGLQTCDQQVSGTGRPTSVAHVLLVCQLIANILWENKEDAVNEQEVHLSCPSKQYNLKAERQSTFFWEDLYFLLLISFLASPYKLYKFTIQAYFISIIRNDMQSKT